MMRAAKADRNVYEEVEADTTATSQALTVVVISAVASGIGGAIGAAMSGTGGNPVGGLIGGIILALIGWAVWSGMIYVVGTKMFKGQATYGEVLRTIGFAESPGVVNVLSFIPAIGGIIGIAVAIWRVWTSWVATKAALDLDTGNTIATIVVSVIVYLVIMFVVGSLLAVIGLGGAMMMGAARA